MLVLRRLVRVVVRIDSSFPLAFAYASTAFLTLNLALTSGLAQQSPSGSRPTATTAKPVEAPLIPAGVRAVLDTLAGVPPEFHADALLLLAESNEKLDRATKLKFIREAFDQATMASGPVKMRSGVMLQETDSESGRSNSAYGLNLDRVSLLSRSIMDLATFDPVAARKLGYEMRLPEIPSVGCENALVYDVKAYYTALQALARDRRQVPGSMKISTFDLLDPAVRQLQTHTQVPLVLQLLDESSLSSKEMETLTGEFTSQLSRLREDERGFAAEMVSSSAIERVDTLYRNLEANSPGSGSALLKEYRQYLVENYRAGGCGQLWNHMNIGVSDNGGLNIKIQNLRKPDDPAQQSLPDSIKKFNDTFHDVLDRAGLGAIRLKEIDVDMPEVAAEQHRDWIEPEAAALLGAAKQLRFDDHDRERTESERESSAWRAQAISFLGRVDDWKADPSRSVEVLFEKDELYRSVIDLAPQEDVRFLAIEKSVALVEDSGLEMQDPSAWMDLALSVQREVGRFEGGQEKKTVNPKLTRRFLNSSNASLRLIGYLDALGIDPHSSGPLGK